MRLSFFSHRIALGRRNMQTSESFQNQVKGLTLASFPQKERNHLLGGLLRMLQKAVSFNSNEVVISKSKFCGRNGGSILYESPTPISFQKEFDDLVSTHPVLKGRIVKISETSDENVYSINISGR